VVGHVRPFLPRRFLAGARRRVDRLATVANLLEASPV
jgi:hypothetical protein